MNRYSLLFYFIFLISISYGQKVNYSDIPNIRGNNPEETEERCKQLLVLIDNNSALYTEYKFVKLHCKLYSKLFAINLSKGDFKSAEFYSNVNSISQIYYGTKRPFISIRSQKVADKFEFYINDLRTSLLIKSGNLREAEQQLLKNPLYYSSIYSVDRSKVLASHVAAYYFDTINVKHRSIRDTVIGDRLAKTVSDTAKYIAGLHLFKVQVAKNSNTVDTVVYFNIISKKHFIEDSIVRIETIVENHKTKPLDQVIYVKPVKDSAETMKLNSLMVQQSFKVPRFSVFDGEYYRVLNTAGDYYYAKQKYDSSISFYKKYILLMHNYRYSSTDIDLLGRSYIQLAEVYIKIGNANEALRIAKSGYRILKHRWARNYNVTNAADMMLASTTIAESYRNIGDTKNALKWSNEGKRYFVQNSHDDGIQPIAWMSNRAMIYWSIGNLDSAYYYFSKLSNHYLHYINKNFSYLSEHERLFIYNSTYSYIEITKAFFAAQLVSNGQLAEKSSMSLLELNINSKGILLSSARKEMDKIYNSENPEVIDLFNSIKKIKNQLAFSADKNSFEIQDLNRELDKNEKKLNTYLNIRQEEFFSIADVLQAIPDSTQLVEIVRCNLIVKNTNGVLDFTDSSAYVYFVSNKERNAFDAKYNLNGKYLNSKAFITYSNSIRYNITSDLGYKNYWKIISPLLFHSNVIVSSDGVYHLLSPNSFYDGNQYLIEGMNLFSISSSRELIQTDTVNFQLNTIELFGRPDFSNFYLVNNNKSEQPNDLPGTEYEVKSICGVVPLLMKCNIVTGVNANENRLKQISSPSILHLATHGYFNANGNGNPLLSSGLLLSINDIKSEDGKFTAYEASNLDLRNTNLVVLSACETGLGELKEGDGVWGLQRAFQVAGVRYVIMSLYKVNDQVTSELMLNFYQNLSKGLTIPIAFKEAEVQIKRKYIDPKFWGAFKLIGY